MKLMSNDCCLMFAMNRAMDSGHWRHGVRVRRCVWRERRRWRRVLGGARRRPVRLPRRRQPQGVGKGQAAQHPAARPRRPGRAPHRWSVTYQSLNISLHQSWSRLMAFIINSIDSLKTWSFSIRFNRRTWWSKRTLDQLGESVVRWWSISNNFKQLQRPTNSFNVKKVQLLVTHRCGSLRPTIWRKKSETLQIRSIRSIIWKATNFRCCWNDRPAINHHQTSRSIISIDQLPL